MKEGEAAVYALKKGKSAGADNIPLELVQAGGKAMIDAITSVCNKKNRQMTYTMDSDSGNYIPKERQHTAVPEVSSNEQSVSAIQARSSTDSRINH